MHKVDLELTDAHLVHKGVTRDTQCRHASTDLIKERLQAIAGADTKGARPHLAATIQADRWLKRLGIVTVGLKQKELQFGRHHRGPAALGVLVDHTAQQRAGRQPG